MTAASLANSAGNTSGVAFGNLVDLARLQVGSTSAVICEACSTINVGSALFCRCCSHKLPAFHATSAPGEQVPQPKAPRVIPDRAWPMDFAVFWLVIGSLVIITRYIPIL
ncbi:hypothetical protein [Variovorax sp. MHTC-1]|uniref:hypothetical protein n=1 Tax=Variovorax sp. MHTC-1 TaxID=2495593 RepID=UPI000F8718A0|nr:hypothetical protein [Variovorax sp. MHTC-1]RST47360.1 hypothetical protein EJI01_27965 [Variovorax sp. MHTC-1]